MSITKIAIEHLGYGPYYNNSTGGSSYILISPLNPKKDVQIYNNPSNNTYYPLFANNTNKWWWVSSGSARSASIRAIATATLQRGGSTYQITCQIARTQ